MKNSVRILIVIALLAQVCGCIFPLPDRVSAGHRYSEEALKFLDGPHTTREHVLISFGRPLIEDTDSRVLLYSWEMTGGYGWFIPEMDLGDVNTIPVGGVVETAERKGLFIAYDENGLIVAREERNIGTSGYREQCAAWRLGLGK